jgi:hypothetical protein
MRIVDGPGWNHEAIASLYWERRLTIDQNLALPFDDIAHLFARMSVASGRSPWRNRDARDDRLVTSGDVLGLYNCPLNAGILGEEPANGNDSKDSLHSD